MRLSDQCFLDGCNKPHFRKAKYEDPGGHKYYFCGNEHLTTHADERHRKQEEIDTARRQRYG